MANFARVLVRYPKESPRVELIVEQVPNYEFVGGVRSTEESPQRRQFRHEVKEIGGEILSPFTEMQCAPLIARGVLNGIIPIQEVRDLVLALKESELVR